MQTLVSAIEGMMETTLDAVNKTFAQIEEWGAIFTKGMEHISVALVAVSEKAARTEDMLVEVSNTLDDFHNATHYRKPSDSAETRLSEVEETLIALGKVLGDFRAEVYEQKTKGKRNERPH